MKIYPSIMCADPLRLGEALDDLAHGEADGIHVDVMDGHFVPGFTFGRDAVAAMARRSPLPLDVHLMSDIPLQTAVEYWDLPIESLSVHVEASFDVLRVIESIKRHVPRAGIAISPGTPISAVTELLPYVDKVLVMGVCPGFVGQQLIPEALQKAGRLARLAAELGYGFEVVFDGGVKAHNAGHIAGFGVDGVVSGSGVFSTGGTIADAIRALKAAASATAPAAPAAQ